MSRDVDQVMILLREFVKERRWGQFHDPKNLAMCLASETGELLAELRWVSGQAADQHCREEAARDRVAAELGDVGIAWLLLCDRIGLDPMAVVTDKLARNATKYPAEASRGNAERPTLG